MNTQLGGYSMCASRYKSLLLILLIISNHVFSMNRSVLCLLNLQLEKSYSQRDSAIKRCISQVSTTVTKLREARAQDPDNVTVNRNLKKERTKVRV